MVWSARISSALGIVGWLTGSPLAIARSQRTRNASSIWNSRRAILVSLISVALSLRSRASRASPQGAPRARGRCERRDVLPKAGERRISVSHARFAATPRSEQRLLACQARSPALLLRLSCVALEVSGRSRLPQQGPQCASRSPCCVCSWPCDEDRDQRHHQ